MAVETLWIAKHAPRSLAECAGNDEAREEMRRWALAFSSGKPQKPLLIFGPPGVGKTACAHGLAADFGWGVVETNASDLRDKENLQKVAGLAASSGGLFGQMLLLFDEVDGAFDRGEVPGLLGIAKEARRPVVMTANDAWNPKLAPLRPYCKMLEFKSINLRAVKSVVERIAKLEKVDVSLADQVAQASSGDLRGAINDLQAGVSGERDRRKNIFRVVSAIFKATDYASAMKAANESEEDFDLLFRWIEENIPAEYEKPDEVAAAYDALSRADVFKGRIRRRQRWSLAKYSRALAIAGVAASKHGKYFKFSKYSFPGIVKALGAAKASRANLKAAWLKAGARMHCSARTARESLAFIGGLAGAAGYFAWDEDEAGAVKGTAR